MKKVFLSILLVLGGALLCPLACPAQSSTATYVVDFTWTNNDAGYPVCSASVTTWCELGKTMTDTTTAGSSQVVCSAIAPAAAKCTTSSYTIVQFPIGSTHTYALTIQFEGATAGTVLDTAPVTVSVTNGSSPGNPTGATGTARQVSQ